MSCAPPVASAQTWRSIMNRCGPRILALTAALQWACWLVAPITGAAPAAPAAIKVKQEAEARGYAFESSHDDIVARAKKEGRVRVLSSLEGEMLKPVAEAFRKKYPFIDLRAEEIGGTDTYQRM